MGHMSLPGAVAVHGIHCDYISPWAAKTFIIQPSMGYGVLGREPKAGGWVEGQRERGTPTTPVCPVAAVLGGGLSK